MIFFILSFRYRKVCIPLGRQITQGQAKILCLIALCISAALSWPAPVLYGHSTVQTKNPNITGVRCFTEDQFKSSIYQAIFNEMLIVIFFSMFIILVILYSLMARIIWKHDEFRRSFAVSGTTMKRRLKNIDIHSGESDIDISAVSSDVMLTLESSTRSYDIKTVHQTIGPVHSSFTQNSLDSTNSYIGDATNNAVRGRALDDARSDKALRSDGTDNGDDKKKSHYKNFLQLHIMKKTTIMMFLITAVFLISYIPHLTLKIVLFVKKDFLINMNFAEKLLYNTFVWCFFINNMANSLIYGFVDIRFRQNVISLYSRFCCRHRSWIKYVMYTSKLVCVVIRYIMLK